MLLLNLSMDLKYGFNPHQKSNIVFKDNTTNPFQLLNGNLGLINVIDIIHGWLTVKEVDSVVDLPAAISMKHTSLAGLAVGNKISNNTLQYFGVDSENTTSVSRAFMKSRVGDPLSSFGDFICISRKVDIETAKLIKREICDGIAAPEFDLEALELLKSKKQGKFIVIEMNLDYYNKYISEGWTETKEIYGVTCSQQNNYFVNDFSDISDSNLRIDCVLANSALKYTQSNNISFALNGQIIGMGCGQQNRVGCVRLAGDKAINWLKRQTPEALEYWKSLSGKRQEKVNKLYENIDMFSLDSIGLNIVMASDGFFPFPDNIELANSYKVKHIIHPGGSIADKIIEEACDKLNIKLYITGHRMFYH